MNNLLDYLESKGLLRQFAEEITMISDQQEAYELLERICMFCENFKEKK